jgi:hypothetical protein
MLACFIMALAVCLDLISSIDGKLDFLCRVPPDLMVALALPKELATVTPQYFLNVAGEARHLMRMLSNNCGALPVPP